MYFPFNWALSCDRHQRGVLFFKTDLADFFGDRPFAACMVFVRGRRSLVQSHCGGRHFFFMEHRGNHSAGRARTEGVVSQKSEAEVSMVRRTAFFAALWLGVGTGPVFGEALPLYTLAPVQVTAARAAESAKKTPQAVQVVTQETIQTLGAVNAKEALALADSLDLSEAVHTSASPAAGNAVMIRGMNTNHTLILVDGMRMADEDTSQTRNVYLLSRIPADQIQRIEILRGAGSALYGSDALGGVINIITKKPALRESVWQAWTGTDSMGQSLQVGTGTLGRWNVNVEGMFETLRPVAHPQSYRTNYGGAADVLTEGNDVPEFGHRAVWRLDGTYDFHNKNQNQIRLTADAMKESLETHYADSTGMGLVLTKNQRDLTNRERQNTALTYTGETGRHAYFFRTYWSQMKKWSHTFNDRGYLPPSLRPGMPDLNAAFPTYEFDQARYSLYGLEGRDTAQSGAHHVTYGGEFLRTAYSGTRLSGDNVPSAYAMESWAAYVSDQWDVSRRLYLTPSLRLERNSRSGNAAIPKIGAAYSWNDHTRLKAEYGSGYRAPSVSELFLHMDRSTPMGTIQVRGNPALAPERSKSWSLSMEKEWGRSFGKASYFDNEVKNLIEAAAQDGSSHLYRYENISRAHIRGTEWELGRHMTDRLTVKVTGTTLAANDETNGLRLEGRAKERWQLQLLYDDGNANGWSGVLWNTWTHGYYFRSRDWSWSTLHLSVEKRWGMTKSLSFGVDNLLNQKQNDLYLTGRSWHVVMHLKL